MPHISLKMLKGRTDEQKKAACEKLTQALCEAVGCNAAHVSCTIEDYTAEEWQEIFVTDIEEKQDKLYKKPEYDPKDLL